MLKIQLSIVTPAFNEELNLPLLYERLLKVLEPTGISWEWIIVDDHSEDNTFLTAKQLFQEDNRISVYRFSHNSGSHSAIFCGLDKAKGNCAIVLAADLQDPPEEAVKLLKEWEKGSQIVWAVRHKREGHKGLQLFLSRAYYWFLKNVVKIKSTPAEGADFFLLDRVVLDALRLFPEKNVSILSLLAWLGFRQTFVSYDKKMRVHGKSNWTLRKKIKLVVDSLISFSSLPLRLMSYTGLFTAVMGVLYATFIVFSAGVRPEGWASLIVVVLVIGGLQMVMLGVLGEYIWRILEESRQRPRYTLEESLEEKNAHLYSQRSLNEISA